MFIFGHLGFGHTLARPWRRSLPWLALGVGMLLPDLIDKPLYYSRLTPWFSCTRTIGHTTVLIGTIWTIGLLRHSLPVIAVGFGMTTHVLLDIALELTTGDRMPGASWIAATWPLHGWNFYRLSFTMAEHVGRLLTPPIILSELVGIGLLIVDWRRGRRE